MQEASESRNLGYLRGFHEMYHVGKELGRGGSGRVFLAIRKADSKEFAAKVIPKRLSNVYASEKRRQGHMSAIRGEVNVLLALRGTLNVAFLEEVYEDDSSVILAMELCKGGRILKHAGRRRLYSEKSVARILTAVLQTVAQCHARGIIHRDIKPENFLYLEDQQNQAEGTIKAVDFGIALFYAPHELPLQCSTAEGTPWCVVRHYHIKLMIEIHTS